MSILLGTSADSAEAQSVEPQQHIQPAQGKFFMQVNNDIIFYTLLIVINNGMYNNNNNYALVNNDINFFIYCAPIILV